MQLVDSNTFTDASGNIPPDWDWKTLSSIAKTGSGGTPSRRNSEYFNGDIPWIKSGELNNGLVLDSEEKITRAAIDNSSAKLLPKGTLLIAMYGATIGKLGILGIEGATNQAVCSIFPDDSIDKQFLFYYLKSIRSSLLERSFGGAQPNISQTVIKSIKVPVPPTTELQRRIVLRIEALLHEVQESRKICDRMHKDADRLLETVVNEVLVKLEDASETVELSEVATAFNGKAVGEGDGYIRVFKSKHCYPHSLRMDRPSYIKEDQIRRISNSIL
jgi:type I restriction enzyme S subunit